MNLRIASEEHADMPEISGRKYLCSFDVFLREQRAAAECEVFLTQILLITVILC